MQPPHKPWAQTYKEITKCAGAVVDVLCYEHYLKIFLSYIMLSIRSFLSKM